MTTLSNKEIFLGGGLTKILEEQWQVDLRLKAMDSDECSAISVHKLILASKSDVFKKMLESDEVKNMKEKVETVTISDMKHEELEAFVEFMYSDGSILSEKMKKHVRSLYVAADKYMVLHLRDLCRDELITSMKWFNVLDLLELSQIPFDKVLNDAAFKFIKANISTIAMSEKFKVFVVSNPNLAVEMMKNSLVSRRGFRHCSNCQTYISCSYSGKCSLYV